MRTSRMKYRVDIFAIADRGAASLRAGGQEALMAARSKFDGLSSQRFTRSGRTLFPMGASMRVSRRSANYILHVTSKKLPMWKFEVTPSPTGTATTGSNRQRISFAFRRGQTMSLDKGFIWNGIVYRRIGGSYVIRKNGSHGSGHITTANKLMRETFSPSMALGDLAPEVLAELVFQVSKSMRGAMK